MAPLAIFSLALLSGALRAEFLGNYTSHEIRPEGLLVRAGTPALLITPFASDVIRVTVLPDGVVTLDTSFVIVSEPDSEAFQIEARDSSLRVTNGAVTLEIRKFPVRLNWIGSLSPNVSDEAGVYFQDSARGVRFRLTVNEQLYGGGERAHGLGLRSRRFTFYNAPTYCYGFGTGDLNIGIPFVCSTREYGLYFDNTYPGFLDVGLTRQDVLEYGTSGGQLSYYTIIGSSPREILARFTELTGRQPLPPRWALGYLQSRYGYQSEGEARSVVTAFRSQGIPLDAIILDLYWFGWGQMGDFDWDGAHWPNPAGMMSDFATQGVKTILITEPYILESSSNYSYAASHDYFATDTVGSPILIQNFWAGPASLLDITDPEAADWLWDLYAARTAEGAGGWWCDLGEPEAHPEYMRHHLGSAARVHNVFSLLWAQRLYEGYRSEFPNQRVFNLIRSGFAGMQRYATVPWSGDVQRSYSGLQAQLPILLSMGMSGVPMAGSDIGGFDCGSLDPELYVRWMQFGTFSPLMRAHGVGVITEPVYFDPTTRGIVRDFIRLRYSLLPYNYTLAFESHTTGAPLARPLFFEEFDLQSEMIWDEYLWGPSLLAAPVLNAGQRQRELLLPEGVWIDFWNDVALDGGRQLAVSAPLDKIPLFVRAGAIIPMVPPVETTRDYRSDTLFVHVYPAPSEPASAYTMYEDDGSTPDAYSLGRYETVSFEQSFAGDQLLIEAHRDNHGYSGSPDRRKMHFVVHRVSEAPQTVRANGVLLTTVTDYTAYLALDSAVYWNPAERRLYVGLDWAGELVVIDVDGTRLLGADIGLRSVPEQLSLEANYPNPFNNLTIITFSLPRGGHITLDLYDLLGRRVRALIDGMMSSGSHAIAVDARELSSGLYFARLNYDGHSLSRKILVLR